MNSAAVIDRPACSPHPVSAQAYRRDIDAMRALAILPVILFHAFPALLPGGYVGVDVFFVISGFLIGGIIYKDAVAGSFSYRRFYARRMKRILPALLCVVLSVAILGLVVLSPKELQLFGGSALAALFGVSNIVFWKSISYFSPDAQNDLLLMTWSLGVEEQFYVVLPILMIWACRWHTARLPILILLGCLLSFAAGMWLTNEAPWAAFYLLPSRAWELGLGVFLAVMLAQGRVPARLARSNAAAAAGLLLMGGAVLMFDESMPFPGSAAAVPVLGTLLLLATADSRINRALGAAVPLRGIGLISYSWYLWHWPILVLIRTSLGAPLGWAEGFIGAGMSLLLAWLTWKHVEQPFRTTALPDLQVLRRYGGALLAIAALPAILLLGGLPQRLGGADDLNAAERIAELGGPCLATFNEGLPRPDCRSGPGPAIALLGDSHANALAPGVQEMARLQKLQMVQITKSSCPFLINVSVRLEKWPKHEAECRTFNRRALETILSDPSIGTVVIAGHWSTEASLVEDHPEMPDGRAEMASAVARTVSTLLAAGKNVLVLGDTPRLLVNPVRLAYADVLPARGWVLQLLRANYQPGSGRVSRALVAGSDDGASNAVAGRLPASPRLRYAALHRQICDAHGCRIRSDNGEMLFLDDHHLSAAGAMLAFRNAGLLQPQSRLAKVSAQSLDSDPGERR